MEKCFISKQCSDVFITSGCSIIASFSYIYISQCSVATQSRCGGILNDCFIANFPECINKENCLKSVNIWQKYGQKLNDTFLLPTVY